MHIHNEKNISFCFSFSTKEKGEGNFIYSISIPLSYAFHEIVSYFFGRLYEKTFSSAVGFSARTLEKMFFHSIPSANFHETNFQVENSGEALSLC